MSEKGVHHAAVDDAEGQPHEHGHDVLGQGIVEAVFGKQRRVPGQRDAGVNHLQRRVQHH